MHEYPSRGPRAVVGISHPDRNTKGITGHPALAWHLVSADHTLVTCNRSKPFPAEEGPRETAGYRQGRMIQDRDGMR